MTRFSLTIPQGQRLTLPRTAVTISPDGTRLVYAADGRLYIRSMAELDAREIAGTDPAINPVFSPDGQSLLYWADAKLKRIALAGGTATTICQAASVPSGIAWGNDGILFALSGTGILRVSPNGGKPDVLVALNN